MGLEVKRAARIAKLNDKFRRKMCSPHRDQLGTDAVYTEGIYKLLSRTGDSFWFFSLIGMYDAFSEDNDPYGEHDFGSLSWYREEVVWKIGYFDEGLRYGCDPLDPNCRRLLTIMLASEY